MKKILFFSSLYLISSLGYAGHTQEQADNTVAVCNTKIPNLDDPTAPSSDMSIKISSKSNGELVAQVTNPETSYGDEVVVIEDKIRPNLVPLMGPDSEEIIDISDYNTGEKILAHAMSFETNPIFNKLFSTGITDLSAVRSVKMYMVGEILEDSVGSTVIVQAKDSNGKSLGSFFGGFFVTPCN